MNRERSERKKEDIQRLGHKQILGPRPLGGCWMRPPPLHPLVVCPGPSPSNKHVPVCWLCILTFNKQTFVGLRAFTS